MEFKSFSEMSKKLLMPHARACGIAESCLDTHPFSFNERRGNYTFMVMTSKCLTYVIVEVQYLDQTTRHMTSEMQRLGVEPSETARLLADFRRMYR